MNPMMFSILLTLLEKRKVTRDFLSEKYELSTRTISRYVDALLEAGVPIISVTGHGGGYMLPDDYKVERMFFNDSEKDRLCEMLEATSHHYRDSLNGHIKQKLLALGKSPSTASNANIFNNNLIIDAGPWGAPQRYTSKIDVINSAVNEKRTLKLQYTDKNVTCSERLVDPYNLALKQGVWYLYGFCHARDDFRLFKVSRINRIVVTEKKFSLRPDADVYDKLSAHYNSSFSEIEIIIEFSSLVLTEIEEWLGIDAIDTEGLQYRAKATIYDGPELISKIMSFGSGVKVISPASLKDKVIAECRLMMDN